MKNWAKNKSILHIALPAYQTIVKCQAISSGMFKKVINKSAVIKWRISMFTRVTRNFRRRLSSKVAKTIILATAEIRNMTIFTPIRTHQLSVNTMSSNSVEFGGMNVVIFVILSRLGGDATVVRTTGRMLDILKRNDQGWRKSLYPHRTLSKHTAW